jgi:hypothetical protein
MQIPEQGPGQGRRGNPDWKPGVSANPAGKESRAARRARIEIIVAEWARPFGGIGVLAPAELMLARKAAELSLCRPKRAEDTIRYCNTVGRLLAQCGLANKHEREPIEPEETPPSAPAFNALNWLREKERSA